MKAIVQKRYGPPEAALELTEIPVPEPGRGEVLVRMRATSVNTPDWGAVTGTPRILRVQTGLRSPHDAVRGSDIAGTVAAVGEGVTDLAEGDDVWGQLWTGGFPTSGTFAEYTVAPASQLIPKPAQVGFEEAAAAAMSGLTALTAVRDVGRVGPGTRLLINGASGGVGTFAVQLAGHYGADVTAVCGPANQEPIRALGAARTIDYTTTDFTTEDRLYEVILDNVLNHAPRNTIRALERGGILMPNSVGNTGGTFAGLGRMAGAALLGLARRADVRFVNTKCTRENLTDLAGMLTAGAITSVIDHAYAFEETPKAVAHMLSHRARGNIVITMPA